MAATITVESATQTSEIGSDEEEYYLEKSVMESPRVVIDTSPAFDSVDEAVLHFGGRGFWVPHPLHPSSLPLPDLKEPDMYSLEDQSATMLKDLHMKEQETLEILKELELTKRLVEELKLRLPKETQPCIGYDNGHDQMLVPEKDKESLHKHVNIGSINNHATKLDEHSTVGLIMMELKQAKLNLNQNTNELAAIRASVESLSEKMEKEKSSVEKAHEIKSSSHLKEPKPNMPIRNDIETLGGSINPILVSKGLQELNYEAEQFMKTADATRSEVLKAMSGIEQTKTCLRVIQMRWVAAKKLEEAARAAESLALAEIRAFSNNNSATLEGCQQNPGRISLTLEEYSILMDKARKAESRKDLGGSFSKIEKATEEKLSNMTLEEVLGRVEVMNKKKVSFAEPVRRFGSDSTQRKPPMGSHSSFRNSFQSNPRRDSRLIEGNGLNFMQNEFKPVLRPTTSIGDILSKKLVLRDDLDVDRQGEDDVGRQRVSLNQMLRQQRGETSPVNKRKDDVESKKFFSKRKALGFVHITLPLSKSSKNKIQALN